MTETEILEERIAFLEEALRRILRGGTAVNMVHLAAFALHATPEQRELPDDLEKPI